MRKLVLRQAFRYTLTTWAGPPPQVETLLANGKRNPVAGIVITPTGRCGHDRTYVGSGHIQLLINLDADGTRHTVLAQRASSTRQTMGRVVKELAQNGYVKVTPDKTDNRAQQVQLTDRGRAFLAAIPLTDLEQVFSEVVGEEKLIKFMTTLHQLMAFTEARRQQLDL